MNVDLEALFDSLAIFCNDVENRLLKIVILDVQLASQDLSYHLFNHVGPIRPYDRGVCEPRSPEQNW